MTISRRYFLKNGGIAMLGMASLPSFLQRAVAATAGPNKKKMVVLFQRGAMDGLNVVVPFAEPNYYRLRPTIAIPAPSRGGAEAAIDLDGFFGLHPSLAAAFPALSEGPACHRAGSWFTRSFAIPFRRAGFHGIRHARREVHRRRVAEPRAAVHAREPGFAVPRRGVRPLPAAHACRQRAHGGHPGLEAIQNVRPAADGGGRI